MLHCDELLVAMLPLRRLSFFQETHRALHRVGAQIWQNLSSAEDALYFYGLWDCQYRRIRRSLQQPCALPELSLFLLFLAFLLRLDLRPKKCIEHVKGTAYNQMKIGSALSRQR